MEKRLTIKDYLKSLGPGAIMAAAIIGPGTVTTASTQEQIMDMKAFG